MQNKQSSLQEVTGRLMDRFLERARGTNPLVVAAVAGAIVAPYTAYTVIQGIVESNSILATQGPEASTAFIKAMGADFLDRVQDLVGGTSTYEAVKDRTIAELVTLAAPVAAGAASATARSILNMRHQIQQLEDENKLLSGWMARDAHASTTHGDQQRPQASRIEPASSSRERFSASMEAMSRKLNSGQEDLTSNRNKGLRP